MSEYPHDDIPDVHMARGDCPSPSAPTFGSHGSRAQHDQDTFLSIGGIDAIPCGIASFALGDDPTFRCLNTACLDLFCRGSDIPPLPLGENLLDRCDTALRTSLLDTLTHSVAADGLSLLTLATGGEGEERYLGFTSLPRAQVEGEPPNHLVAIVDLTERELVLRDTRWNADHDILTGICNSTAFIRKTKAMFRDHPDERYVLGVIDIDNFKVINDLFGNRAGDGVLRLIAQNLRTYFDEFGTFSRFTGDNFAFCAPADRVKPGALFTGLDTARIKQQLSYAVMCHEGLYPVDDPNLSIEDMCDRATMALKSVEDSYITRFAYYTDSMLNDLMTEQRIVNEMEDALVAHDFALYYQPVFDAVNGGLVSAEALIRWIHPTRGVINPDSFIPVFERNGFITKLDAYAWEEACAWIEHRRQSNRLVVPISVNLSRTDIYRPDLIDTIDAITRRHGVTPSNLHFEITEGAYVEDSAQLVQVIDQLHARGYQILMDDFGSGYSSLNTLKDLRVDTLKIDRGFIEGVESNNRTAGIIASVIRLARRLNIPTIAEGVETRAQYDLLRGIGCDCIQGFYLSRPLSVTKFETLLDMDVHVPADRFRNPAPSDSSTSGFDGEMDARPVILVADDDAIGRGELRANLSKEYRVIEAGDGREALDIMRTNPDRVDLLLLDTVMPIANGYDVLEEMHGNPVLSNIPVIVMSKAGNGEIETMALEYGADDFVRKPYNPFTIQMRIENLLRSHSPATTDQPVRSVLDNLPNGIVIYEVKDIARIHYVNRTLAAMYELTPAEFIARYRDTPFDMVRENDRSRIQEAIAQSLRGCPSGEEAQTYSIEASYTITIPSGEERSHLSRIHPVLRGDGSELVYTVVTDMTTEGETQA